MANKLVNGVVLPLTAEEEAERAAKEAEYSSKAPERIKAAAIKTINATFKEEIAAVKEGYTEDEIKSWPQQIAEATAYQLSPTAETPLLDAIIATSGDIKDDLVLKIVANSKQYSKVFGNALGKKNKSIKDLTN